MASSKGVRFDSKNEMAFEMPRCAGRLINEMVDVPRPDDMFTLPASFEPFFGEVEGERRFAAAAAAEEEEGEEEEEATAGGDKGGLDRGDVKAEELLAFSVRIFEFEAGIIRKKGFG